MRENQNDKRERMTCRVCGAIQVVIDSDGKEREILVSTPFVDDSLVESLKKWRLEENDITS